ncbi:MutS protein 1 [Neophaeococcomyces mojaviensis]|uniref:MutS protein 1 n=1 Tax=Neophaeococcomyces mojaviensis TaxID=3383035 RepID=A0ACC3A758_9EURO|nr:MutS protein 1 [Knufia sp. JES_112]
MSPTSLMLVARKYVRTSVLQRLPRSSLPICYHRIRREILLQRFRYLSTSNCYAAKRVTKRQVKELVQGQLEGEALLPADKDELRKESLTQVVKNYMKKFSNCVVLTRVGNFYELYFEHASTYGPLLDLRVAYKGKDGVPMAGFQYMYLDKYLKKLVQDLDKHVAVCEEFPEHDINGKLQTPILRKVTRVVTPGTLIDEEFMIQDRNNFLLAIYLDTGSVKLDEQTSIPAKVRSQSVGLAWIDISTGEFYVQNATRAGLSSALLRIGASEVVLSDNIPSEMHEEISLSLGLKNERFASLPAPSSANATWNERLDQPFTTEQQSRFSAQEVAASQILFDYVDKHLLEFKLKPRQPQQKEQHDIMAIDRSSVRGLELLQTAKDGLGKGSLLNTIRRTVTKGGGRLLRERLIYPSIIPKVIEHRLDLVSAFVNTPTLHTAIIVQLRSLFDISRIVQKFSLNRGDAEEMLCLANTFLKVKEILQILEQHSQQTTAEGQALKRLISQVVTDGPQLMTEQIRSSIDEQGLINLLTRDEGELPDEDVGAEDDSEPVEANAKVNLDKNGREDPWIMRRNASRELSSLHAQLDALIQQRDELQGRLREQLSSPKLILKYDNRYGHVCHAPRTRSFNESALQNLGANPIGILKTSRLFHLTEWTNLGRQTDTLKYDVRTEESKIFQRLRQLVIDNLVPLRQNASVMDELDLVTSFATLANEEAWVRPTITTNISHNIVGGRHPTVKIGLQEKGLSFVTNDLHLDRHKRAWLITGPNMAGKSTFLRQSALITILAQVGCYVPAEYAEIGIVDRVFSRIGAADDLFRSQSTFMVEMLETAAILRDATERSFVIMDEVGRGTAPEDGTAVAYASLHHLCHINKCRVLFATHFHELADLTDGWEQLAQYCTDLYEEQTGSFTFVHKLRPGVNRKSHALRVAGLAGLPQEALGVAQEMLDRVKVQTRKQLGPSRKD